MELPAAAIVTVLLSAIAFVASVVLIWKSRGLRALPGCGAGSGCDEVISSRWAKVGLLPVAWLGAAVYLAMIGSALAAGRGNDAIAREMLVCAGAVALGAAIWFVAIQLLVIRRFCVYCTTAHLAAGVAGGIAIASFHAGAMPMVIGAAIVVMLAVTQVLVRPELTKLVPAQDVMQEAVTIETAEAEPIVEKRIVEEARPVALRVPKARQTRRIVLVNGAVSLDAGGFPMVGAMDAPHLIANVVDYTCETCRYQHGMVRGALQQMQGKIGLVVIPAPLERACNSSVPAMDAKHEGACHYARLALAVWDVAPEAFEGFHEWLFEGEKPPALAAARERAAEIIGQENVDAAAGSQGKYLADGVKIYAGTGAGYLPKLLLPTGILWGKSSSVETLAALLREQVLRGAQLHDVAPVMSPRAKGGPFSDRTIG